MTEYPTRRCCHEGCAATQAGGAYRNKAWYRVSRGFMAHACPEHAEIWRQCDSAERIYRTRKYIAWEVAEADFSEQWDHQWAQENPEPARLPMQSSIVKDDTAPIAPTAPTG